MTIRYSINKFIARGTPLISTDRFDFELEVEFFQ